MLPKVVSAMKGSIRHTNQVIRQHNSQADSRSSASAAPLASQSAIVSRFGGSGAKIPTRLDFGENEIAEVVKKYSITMEFFRARSSGLADERDEC